MARALAGAALAGAAAMARVAPPAAARPSTTPLSVSSPEPPNSNPFGLTQVTRGETHDTSPSRVPGSGRSRGGAADEATPSPDPRAATSLRNSVASDASAPAGRERGALAETRSRRDHARHRAPRRRAPSGAGGSCREGSVSAADHGEGARVAEAGDFGERLHENASAKKGGPIAKSRGDGDERRRSRRRARFGAERVRDALRGRRAGAPEGEGARGRRAARASARVPKRGRARRPARLGRVRWRRRGAGVCAAKAGPARGSLLGSSATRRRPARPRRAAQRAGGGGARQGGLGVLRVVAGLSDAIETCDGFFRKATFASVSFRHVCLLARPKSSSATRIL